MALMKRFNALGDGILKRLLPHDTAAADDCTYERKCRLTSAWQCLTTGTPYGYYRRLVCAGHSGPSYGPWERTGCC